MVKHFFLKVVYNAMVVPILHIAFFIAALVNSKARQRQQGLQEMWRAFATGKLAVRREGEPCFWFHASSMGEFEQVKPIIECLRSGRIRAGNVQIVVSFFSPSGYEHQQNYALADAIVYLPLDSKRAVERFLDAVQPSCAIIARYDLWLNMMLALKDRSVPTVLVSATLNEHNALFRFGVGREYLRMVYGLLTEIYTAGTSETTKFQSLGITARVTTAADTRFDRIAAQVAVAQAEGVESFSMGARFFGEEDFVLVLGSSWKPDEDCIIEAMNLLDDSLRKRLRLIVAPHEPTEEAVMRLQQILPESEFLSAMPNKTARHIIVDCMGRLMRLYALADAAFVGGGFGACVHSVAEPSGYGIPLACAANIGRARDAIALHKEGALTLIRSANDAQKWLSEMILSKELCRKRGAIAHNYIHERLGWSERIARVILESTTR